jgi:hypothetical protein
VTEDGKLDLEDLKAMTSVTISNTMAAEVLRMDPGRLSDYAKAGQLKWAVLVPDENAPKGARVYHNREAFIRYWSGESNEPDQTARTVIQAIDDLREELHELRLIMLASLSIGPLDRLDELKQKEAAG